MTDGEQHTTFTEIASSLGRPRSTLYDHLGRGGLLAHAHREPPKLPDGYAHYSKQDWTAVPENPDGEEWFVAPAWANGADILCSDEPPRVYGWDDGLQIGTQKGTVSGDPLVLIGWTGEPGITTVKPDPTDPTDQGGLLG